MRTLLLLCVIGLVSCSKPAPKAPYYAPKYTYYYDTVTFVQYHGRSHDKPRFRLKNDKSTFETNPTSVIVNVGDIVETVKTDYYNSDPKAMHIYFDSRLKGTHTDVIRRD